MADTIATETQASPEITQAFVADREKFWLSFTSFVTYGAVAVGILLIAMWLFLV